MNECVAFGFAILICENDLATNDAICRDWCIKIYRFAHKDISIRPQWWTVVAARKDGEYVKHPNKAKRRKKKIVITIIIGN